MLQVRVVSPPAVTDRLVAYLTAENGVINLALEPSDARLPDGDTVQFDVMRSAANGVLAQLRALGLYRSSSVIVQEVDAALADTANRPDCRVTYHGDYARVWDVVAASIHDTAAYLPSSFILLAFAGVIAACGTLTNSQILVVGAMVVGPEYNAIVSVALGIEQRTWTPVRRGLAPCWRGSRSRSRSRCSLRCASAAWAGQQPRSCTAPGRSLT